MSTDATAKKRKANPKSSYFAKRKEKQKRAKREAQDPSARVDYVATLPREFMDNPTNIAFETYYRGHIIPEDQWEEFYDILRVRLPVSFRVSDVNGCSDEVEELIAGDALGFSHNVEYEGKEYGPLKPLSWYPEAYSTPMDSRALKKIPELKLFRDWMINQFDMGNINRQEVVSMIPPLILGVEPHHLVLDMCAAPGSKTLQLLESMHKGTDNPTGLVIANDASFRRAFMLIHQLQKVKSPNFLVSCHEGQSFPKIYHRVSSGNGEFKEESLLFDRILCDVPCSGDGTLRKCISLWKNWNISLGYGLHVTQLSIAKRAMQLVKVGGYMVYSTCSFNPIENEAVVATLIKHSGGALEIVDCSDRLVGLKRVPGLYTWRVVVNQDQLMAGETVETPEDVPGRMRVKIRPSCFPPALEEAKAMHLERCLRILPHHQNTGGFFITLLKKVKEVPNDIYISNIVNPAWRKGKDAKETEELNKDLTPYVEPTPNVTNIAMEKNKEDASVMADDETAPKTEVKKPTKKKQRRGEPSDDQFDVLPVTPENVKSLMEFFGLPEELLGGRVFATNKHEKKLTYISQQAAQIARSVSNRKFNILFSGLRVFQKRAQKIDDDFAEGGYRIVENGLDLIAPHMTKQRVDTPVAELMRILDCKTGVAVDAAEDVKFKEAIQATADGNVVLYVTGFKNLNGKPRPIFVSTWKKGNSIASMASTEYKMYINSLRT